MAESLGRGTEPMARRPFLFRMLGRSEACSGWPCLFPFASLGPRPHHDLYQTDWKAGHPGRDRGRHPHPAQRHQRQRHHHRLPRGGRPALHRRPEPDPADQPGRRPLRDSEGSASAGTSAAWWLSPRSAPTPGARPACTTSRPTSSSAPAISPPSTCFWTASRCSGRPRVRLPQLPIGTDADGYVISTEGYQEPVGPGFWNRG